MHLLRPIPCALLLCICSCDTPPSETKDAVDFDLPRGKADGAGVEPKGAIEFGGVENTVPIGVGEYHGYDFTALAGGCVDIWLRADVKKEPDTYLFLLEATDSGWREIAEDDDGGFGLNSSIDGFILPSTGEYRIIATSYQGEGDGRYTLSLDCCNDACEPAPEICVGGVDEDADGLVDCDDPDCADAENCSVSDGELCTNGGDDDGDGLTDCWDVDSCFDHAACASGPGRLAASWEGTTGIHFAGDHPTTEWGHVERMPVYGHDLPSTLSPVIVPLVHGASYVTTARQRSCAIVGEGRVYCWGHATALSYELGLGGVWDDWNRIYETPPYQGQNDDWGYVGRAVINETEDYHDPNAYEFSALDHVRQIDAGESHTCAVHSDGTVYCWGTNEFGQLGHVADHYGPRQLTYRIGHALEVPYVSNAVQVSAGERHTCARLDDGRVECWGDNEFGQLGDGTRFNQRTRPELVVGLSDATHVSAGDRQTCAVHGAGEVSCWGEIHTHVAPGLPGSQTTPYAVEGLLFAAEQVETAYDNTCAIGEGAAQCWTHTGMLLGHDRSPSLVPGIEDAAEVAVGVNHACFRRNSGTFLCMGANYKGQLGDGTTAHSERPVAVVTNPI